MQQWEYLTLPESKVNLEKLGLEGWELIAVVSKITTEVRPGETHLGTINYGKVTSTEPKFYFKRPLIGTVLP